MQSSRLIYIGINEMNITNNNVLYQSVATSITLLAWMYLMSLIALLGCEFNAGYERVALRQTE